MIAWRSVQRTLTKGEFLISNEKGENRVKKTMVFMAHDMDEAFKMGDGVCIMKDGTVVQTGTPEHVTTYPADDYVRNFINGANKTKAVWGATL